MMQSCPHRTVVIAALLGLVVAAPLAARTAQPQFVHYSSRDGLAGNTIEGRLFQDSRGFMWFPTNNGLSWYDGARFHTFRADMRDSTALYNAQVKAVTEDAYGDMWILTSGSLCRLDWTTMTISREVLFGDTISFPTAVSFGPDDTTLWIGHRAGLSTYHPGPKIMQPFSGASHGSRSLDTSGVDGITRTSDGRLWIVLREAGVCVLDCRANTVTDIELPPVDTAKLHAHDIAEDPVRRCVWVSTGKGLYRYTKSGGAQHYERFSFGPRADSRIGSIVLDKTGMLWMDSPGGLLRYDPQSRSHTLFDADPTDAHSLSDNQVGELFIDRGDVLWVSAESGINATYLWQKPFVHYRQRVDSSLVLGETSVWEVLVDGLNRLWLGTWREGVVVVDRSRDGAESIRHLPYGYYDPPRGVSGGNVSSLAFAADGRLWIGAADGAVSIYDTGAVTFSHIRPNGNEPEKGTLRWPVWSFWPLPDGDMWIGQRAALERWDAQSHTMIEQYSTSAEDSPTFPKSALFECAMDSKGTLWLASNTGLYRRDPGERQFRRYTEDPLDTTSLSVNAVKTIFEDSRGRFWVGTEGGGLCELDRETGTFTVYRTEDGLSDNAVVGIEEDGHGRLWLSTYNGLTRFDPRTGDMRTYGTHDWLRIVQFSYTSCDRGPDGWLYFGGVGGVVAFHPDSIVDNQYEPPVALTELRMMNKPVHVGDTVNGRQPLPVALNELDELVLYPDDIVFSLEFTAQHYANPDAVRYRYMLTGFDPELVEVSAAKRQATYTSLPPGSYTFVVQATNCDGVWSKPVELLSIRSVPPFWATWWFRLLMGLAVAAGAVRFYYVRTTRMRSRNESLASQVADRTGSLLRIADDIKRSATGLSAVSDSLTQDAQNTTTLAEGTRKRTAHGVESIRELERSLRVLREAARETNRAVATIAASVEQMGGSIGQVTANCQRESRIVDEAKALAVEVRAQVDSLKEEVSHIGSIVAFIDDIAEQTSTLSLNASIQAVKAGKAGRAFGVVADEIKRLSSQTSDATRGIAERIVSIQSAVQTSAQGIVAVADKVGEIRTALQAILDSVDDQNSATGNIAASVTSTTEVADNLDRLSENGQATIARITTDINAVDDAADETLRSMRNTREGIERMRNAVQHLTSLTGQVGTDVTRS